MAEQALGQNEVELPHPPFPLGPGSILKQAREACRLSQEEIAKQLRLNVQRIQEIEENDFSQMKAVIYAQGYLRAYADIVKLPIDSVLESFKNVEWASQERAAQTQEKADKWIRTSLASTKPSSSSRLWLYIATAVITFVVVLLALDYWPKQEERKSKAAVQALTAPAATTAKTGASVAEINLPSVSADSSSENPFVQPLAKTKPKMKTHAKAPIVEAQPVATEKAQ